jgi:hypothetical protein
MKKRQWIVRHSYVEQSDARARWDRSYQSLIQWSETGLNDQPSSPLLSSTFAIPSWVNNQHG